MSSPLFDFQGVSKSFFGVPVLHDVNLSLCAGRVFGLVGENGAGKSTLINIAGGVLAADAGRMFLDGRPYAPRNPAEAARSGIALIHQELNLFTNLSIAENLFLTDFPRRLAGPWIDRQTIRQRTGQLLAELNLQIHPDRLVSELSPGERQLVEIAKGLHTKARVIVFDEPTTSLSRPETERLFAIIAQLRRQGMAVVYISHQLGDIERLCDDVAILRDGRLQATGPVGQFPPSEMIRLMVGRAIEQMFPQRTTPPTRRPVLEVHDLSQPGIAAGINFTLHGGEVLGIAGLMGSGRTELVRMLFGLDRFSTGRITVDGRLLRPSPRRSIRAGMAFLTEDRRREGLLAEASVKENLVLVALRQFVGRGVARGLGLLNRRHATQAAVQTARQLAITCPAIDRQAAKTLSGGNQQKVVLGKWLLNRPKVLLLDEPTRGIDVGAKAEIYALIAQLAAAGAGVLFISSELEELLGLCDRILVMAHGEIRTVVERHDFGERRILQAAFGEEAGA